MSATPVINLDCENNYVMVMIKPSLNYNTQIALV